MSKMFLFGSGAFTQLPQVEISECTKHDDIFENCATLDAENSEDDNVFPANIPRELLNTIVGFLSPKDIKSAVLVNRRWKEYFHDEKFWKWAKLDLYDEYEGIKKEILESERFSVAGTMKLTNLETAQVCCLLIDFE